MFGSSHLYVFSHPEEKKKIKEEGKLLLEVSFEMAQEEIAKNAGFQMKKRQRSNSKYASKRNFGMSAVIDLISDSPRITKTRICVI